MYNGTPSSEAEGVTKYFLLLLYIKMSGFAGYGFRTPIAARRGTSGNNDNTRRREEREANQERMRIEAENKSKEINEELVKILARNRDSVFNKAKNKAKEAFGIVPTPWADAKREATIKVNEKLAKKREEERKYLGFENRNHGGKTKKRRNKKNKTKRRR